VDTISATLAQNLSQIVTSVTTIIGVLVMMLTISWLMTIVALVIIPLSFGLISMVVKRSQKYFKGQQEYLGHVNGHVEETYGGHSVVKAFNGEEKSLKQFDAMNEKLHGSVQKAQFLSGLMMPIMSFVSNLSFVGVAILGGYLAVQGTIQVGDILAFIQYVRSFTQPIMPISPMFYSLPPRRQSGYSNSSIRKKKCPTRLTPSGRGMWPAALPSVMCVSVIVRIKSSSRISRQIFTPVRKSRSWGLLGRARPPW
jgi:ABC-type multidrug transport system fused ATPase/permease subunit